MIGVALAQSLSLMYVYVYMFDRNSIIHQIVLVGTQLPSAIHQSVHQHFKQLKGALLVQLLECQTLMARLRVRISPWVRCCVLEQDASSSLLSTGSTQGIVLTY